MSKSETQTYKVNKRQFLNGRWREPGETTELTETQARYRKQSRSIELDSGKSSPKPSAKK